VAVCSRVPLAALPVRRLSDRRVALAAQQQLRQIASSSTATARCAERDDAVVKP
jgi:hypothetical protein